MEEYIIIFMLTKSPARSTSHTAMMAELDIHIMVAYLLQTTAAQMFTFRTHAEL
jgi:hypothetical protein